MFNLFNRQTQDFYSVRKENVTEYITNGKLENIYLISPNLGGSTGIDNQIVVTPKAAEEKKKIDETLINALVEGKKVTDFKIDMKYKERSIVPSMILIKASIDGRKFNKKIRVW